MNQKKRIGIAVLALVVIAALMLLGETWRRQQQVAENQSQMPPGMATAVPGSVPIYVNDDLVAHFLPTDLEQLPEASFVDAEDGKTQEGWMLRDVLALYLDPDDWAAGTPITVSSSHRDKTITLTWAEVAAEENMVMFDLSGRGTLKLVSLLPQLDTRDEWVQDADEITVTLAE